jgi:hypothetical protein
MRGFMLRIDPLRRPSAVSPPKRVGPRVEPARDVT